MINWYNKPIDAYPNPKDYEKLTFIECGGFNNMTKYEKENILNEVEEYIFNLLKYIERTEPSSEKILNLTQSLLNINKIKEILSND